MKKNVHVHICARAPHAFISIAPFNACRSFIKEIIMILFPVHQFALEEVGGLIFTLLILRNAQRCPLLKYVNFESYMTRRRAGNHGWPH